MIVRVLKALLPIMFAGACATSPGQELPALVLPPRAPTALTGSQLLPALRGLALAERETLVWHEFAAGNVPAFLRRLVPVSTQAQIGGRVRRATFWCTPDYLGIGSDGDWFRMPLTPTLGQQLADRLECVLPTRRMVDAIWAQAPVKLAPFPYSPTVYDILSVELFHKHHLQIESQRRGQPQEALVAGIKKDVVASALLGSSPGRVVIYGWHYPNGTPIQPLWPGHTFGHVDYSHGLRLVARRAEVDGVPTTIDAVLADPALHVLLSDEGPFTSWRYPAAASESFPLHDTFPQAGPQLRSWRAKFKAPQAVATVPPPPSGDPTALRIMDPAGGTDTLRLGVAAVRDVGVQADLLCEHRPGLAGDGFERIGVFVRDQAAGAFDGTLAQPGACYALTWDSHDGRVRCLRVQGGTLTDLLPAPRLLPGTAWRRFRLEARGDAHGFFVDGERLLAATDATNGGGEFGVGFHEYFATNSHMRGTRIDTFHADVPGAFTLGLQQGLAPGELQVRRRRGIPGDLHFTALTLLPGAFPAGWFFGLDPNPADLLGQLASGHPLFVGLLGSDGNHELTVSGLPPGLQLFGVSLDLEPTLRWLQPSAPVAVRTR